MALHLLHLACLMSDPAETARALVYISLADIQAGLNQRAVRLLQLAKRVAPRGHAGTRALFRNARWRLRQTRSLPSQQQRETNAVDVVVAAQQQQQRRGGGDCDGDGNDSGSCRASSLSCGDRIDWAQVCCHVIARRTRAYMPGTMMLAAFFSWLQGSNLCFIDCGAGGASLLSDYRGSCVVSFFLFINVLSILT